MNGSFKITANILITTKDLHSKFSPLRMTPDKE